MIDDHFILSIERLRDALKEAKAQLRGRYNSPTAQVRADDVRKPIARLAETWLVEVVPIPEVNEAITADYLADLTVHFQRLLKYSEQAVQRSRYEDEISAISKEFTQRVVIPLKQRIGEHSSPAAISARMEMSEFMPTAFLAHSFAASDEDVVQCVRRCIEALGISVVTGDKPKADRISDKVKKLIDEQYIFVGLFTRRDKLAGRNEYTTSNWLIDEKAYAFAKGKKLVLLREDGVESLGGIQGDYEFIRFSRAGLHELVVKILQLFNLQTDGLRI